MSDNQINDISKRLDRVSTRALPSVLMWFDAAAMNSMLPFGWSVENLGIGQYRVTHNLELNIPTRLVLHPTPIVDTLDTLYANVTALHANSFDVQVFDSGGSLADSDMFVTGQFILL